ncbi:hypothetical protein C8J57DRAFT_1256869 [Mycena rebaudengoi]|nr:hypothetical protein C8J57DRAFT_1256869 [Mycena rebaudengoi]
MFAFQALLPLFCLLHVVSATQTGTIVRRVDGDPASDSVSAYASGAAPSSSASSPDPDAFLQNHFTIHRNCDRRNVKYGARKRGMIEQAVKDTATILHEAQSIQRDDPAYFLPQGVGGEDDFDTVQKMFDALLNPPDEITITCPKVQEVKECKGALAWTDTRPTDTPTMKLCPNFFTNEETTPKLEDKPFDVPGTGWGTTDVLGKPDENDGNKNTYGGGAKGYASIAAIALRQHWIDHLAQPNTLAEPPVGSTENSESYAAAATALAARPFSPGLGLYAGGGGAEGQGGDDEGDGRETHLCYLSAGQEIFLVEGWRRRTAGERSTSVPLL